MPQDMSYLTWQEFLTEAQHFLSIAEHLNDDWTLYKKNEKEGNSFLVYKQKISYTPLAQESSVIPAEAELVAEQTSINSVEDVSLLPSVASLHILQLEYHIVFSISYQVPVLYFQARKHDGSLLDLEDAWRIFRTYDADICERNRADMLSILTQMEHPVLFRPYLALHPCRTAELLAQAGSSQNRVLTFISLMGPYVQLQLSNRYGLHYTKGDAKS